MDYEHLYRRLEDDFRSMLRTHPVLRGVVEKPKRPSVKLEQAMDMSLLRAKTIIYEFFMTFRDLDLQLTEAKIDLAASRAGPNNYAISAIKENLKQMLPTEVAQWRLIIPASESRVPSDGDDSEKIFWTADRADLVWLISNLQDANLIVGSRESILSHFQDKRSHQGPIINGDGSDTFHNKKGPTNMVITKFMYDWATWVIDQKKHGVLGKNLPRHDPKSGPRRALIRKSEQ